jgi:hypothetical protein
VGNMTGGHMEPGGIAVDFLVVEENVRIESG